VDNEALIRYVCVTDDHRDAEKIAFPYLEAIEGTGLGARVMPLGAMHFAVPPWNALGHLFLSALRTRFVNVVCVPAGTPLVGRGPAHEEASTAIDGLYTVGIPNVCITTGLGEYNPRELRALQLYNEVVVPDEEGSVVLASKGVDSMVVPPESGALSRFFSGITLA
jgi:hypothetical protein